MHERCNFSKVLMVVSVLMEQDGSCFLRMSHLREFQGIQERDQSAARKAAVGKADRVLFASAGSCSAYIVKLALKFFPFFFFFLRC